MLSETLKIPLKCIRGYKGGQLRGKAGGEGACQSRILSFSVKLPLKRRFLFFFFNNFDLLIYFIVGCAGSSLLGVGFLWLWQAGTKNDSLLGRVGCSLQWFLLWSTDSRRAGFSSSGTRA